MGERKGVNKYYPPDYDPNKGGLNKFLGTHALRERARKLNLGILIIRFEMPYNIWCEGCKNHIGMGVRYNAEKKKVGMYYSTPVYQFRMKCHLCNNHFEIKSDPANLDYIIVTGARRQEGRWDPTENEQVVPEDKNVSRKMSVDAMFGLEHGLADKDKANDIKTAMEKLEGLQKSRWKDDYAANGALREIMRAKRKETNIIYAKNKLLNLNIPLLPHSDEDAKMAALLQFSKISDTESSSSNTQKMIDVQPIFTKVNPLTYQLANKKKFARQTMQEIIAVNKKNFATFSKELTKSNIGVKKKNERQFEEINRHLRGKNNLMCEKKNCFKERLIVSYDSSHSDSD